MNIQIFGRKKCFDTKKAERFFKERGIRFQAIDLDRYGMSMGELNSVISSVGLDNVVNTKDPDYELFRHLARREDKIEKLYEIPEMIRTPVVRCGKNATIGYCPDVWSAWK